MLNLNTNMNQTIPLAYDLFLNRLLEEKHGANLDKKLSETMKIDLLGRLENHIMAYLIDAIPNDKASELQKLTEQNPDQAHFTLFFKENIPNMDEVVADALLKFKNVYLGLEK